MIIKMLLKEKIQIHLDQIKQLKGVENAVLTQRDGNPIQSTGVWFSKDEIFNVSSATSAIFNVGIHLHPEDLKYILIEGKKAKILIAPLNSPLHYSLNRILERQGILNNAHEFFIAITAQPNINLGGIFNFSKDLFIPTGYKPAISFVILIVVLLIKPRGILGKKKEN